MKTRISSLIKVVIPTMVVNIDKITWLLTMKATRYRRKLKRKTTYAIKWSRIIVVLTCKFWPAENLAIR